MDALGSGCATPRRGSARAAGGAAAVEASAASAAVEPALGGFRSSVLDRRAVLVFRSSFPEACTFCNFSLSFDMWHYGCEAKNPSYLEVKNDQKSQHLICLIAGPYWVRFLANMKTTHMQKQKLEHDPESSQTIQTHQPTQPPTDRHRPTTMLRAGGYYGCLRPISPVNHCLVVQRGGWRRIALRLTGLWKQSLHCACHAGTCRKACFRALREAHVRCRCLCQRDMPH